MKSVYPYRLALMAGAVALFVRLADGKGHLVPVSALLPIGGLAFSAALRRSRPELIWLGLLVLLLGAAGMRLAASGPSASMPERGFARGETSLTGEIALDSPFLDGGRNWIVEVREDTAGMFSSGERVRVETLSPVSGIGWGDLVTTRGVPVRFRDRARAVSGTLTCEGLEKVGESDRPLVSATNSLREAFTRFCLEEVSGEAEGHLMAGIVLGDLGVLPSEVNVAIRRSGLSHICAASGLNVSILAAMIFGLGRKARAARLVLYPATLVLVVLYVLIIGGKAPMIRAAFAVPLAFLALLVAGEFDMLSAVSSSLLAMVFWEPAWLYSLSFQLSFVSILGIVLLTEPLADALKRGGGKTVTLLAMTLAAQLATIPLIAGCFGEISLTAAPANLLVVPVIPLSMGLGLAGGMMRLMHLPLAWFPAWIAGMAARYVLAVAGAFASPGWATTVVRDLSSFKVAAYYSLLWGVFVWRRGRRWRRPFLVCLLALVGMAAAGSLRSSGPAYGRIVFFDVGQGDAVLVESAGGARVLVDGGEEEYVLRNKLRDYGIRRIDLIILSHPDSDHVGGLNAALEDCEVAAVMETGMAGGADWRRWDEGVAQEGAERLVGVAGETFVLKDIEIEVIAPERSGVARSGAEDGNDMSLVCRITGPGFTLLATGDIEDSEELRLIEEGARLEADILKVPHHGGYAEPCEDFFKAVSPCVSVVSVGAGNRYGHPAESTLQSLARAGSRTYRTDEGGDIIIEAGRNSYEVKVSGGR